MVLWLLVPWPTRFATVRAQSPRVCWKLSTLTTSLLTEIPANCCMLSAHNVLLAFCTSARSITPRFFLIVVLEWRSPPPMALTLAPCPMFYLPLTSVFTICPLCHHFKICVGPLFCNTSRRIESLSSRSRTKFWSFFLTNQSLITSITNLTPGASHRRQIWFWIIFFMFLLWYFYFAGKESFFSPMWLFDQSTFPYPHTLSLGPQ